MAKKLHYFDTIGLAEPIRYILHYGQHKFEDIRYQNKDWPIKSVKDSLPYGQMPFYEEGDRSLNQSLAIARYVANISKLVPIDPWEQAVLDAVIYNIYDFWKIFLPYVLEKDPAKKEEIKKKILSESLDYFFSRFESELKKNNGFFGGKLSWADFILVGIIESINSFFGEKIEKKYPFIGSLMDKIRNLPGVKEYIATRKSSA